MRLFRWDSNPKTHFSNVSGEVLTSSPEQMTVHATQLHQPDHMLHQSILQLQWMICDDCGMFVVPSIDNMSNWNPTHWLHQIKSTLWNQTFTKCPENRKKMSCLYAHMRFLKKNCTYQVWESNTEQKVTQTMTQRNFQFHLFIRQMLTKIQQATSKTTRSNNHEAIRALN